MLSSYLLWTGMSLAMCGLSAAVVHLVAPSAAGSGIPQMKVILANPRGFCAGVNMAIDVVDQLLDICPDETIYVYHEIVHNRHVVSRFKEQGVVFVESLEEVPDGAIAVFSAHGVSPAIRAEAKERNLVAVDATCPLVTKVHVQAIRYSNHGWQILLIGHADHQEVIGTMGEAPADGGQQRPGCGVVAQRRCFLGSRERERRPQPQRL